MKFRRTYNSLLARFIKDLAAVTFTNENDAERFLLQQLMTCGAVTSSTKIFSTLLWEIVFENEGLVTNINKVPPSITLVPKDSASESLNHYLTHYKLSRKKIDKGGNLSIAKIIFNDVRSSVNWIFTKSEKKDEFHFKYTEIEGMTFVVFYIPENAYVATEEIIKPEDVREKHFAVLNRFEMVELEDLIEQLKLFDSYSNTNFQIQTPDDYIRVATKGLQKVFDQPAFSHLSGSEKDSIIYELVLKLPYYSYLVSMGTCVYITNNLYKNANGVLSNGGVFLVEESMPDLTDSFTIERLQFISSCLNFFTKQVILPELKDKLVANESNLRAEKLRSGIISILTDSYAHNISAHSLLTLENWMRQRSALLQSHIPLEIAENDPSKEYWKKLKELGSESSIKYANTLKSGGPSGLQDITLENIIQFEKDLELNFSYILSQAVIRDKMPVPVDFFIWPLFRFLKDKAAFWTGVSKHSYFGGEHISLFQLVFDHFIFNPLYVGTIASTENVRKLNIKVGLVEYNKKGGGTTMKFYDFVQVSAESIVDEESDQKNYTSEKPDYSSNEFCKFELDAIINDYSDYGFIRFGKDFWYIKEWLQKEKVFLPGGIVGVHAFLTIIENSIRNVKHYKHTENEYLANGLTLLLTFEKMDFFNQRAFEYSDAGEIKKSNLAHRLYRVGIALGHKLNRHHQPPHQKIKMMLFDEVITPEGRPRLGGTSQDKVCASFLLNSSFHETERIKNPRNWFYFPWIHPTQLSKERINRAETFNGKLRDKFVQYLSNPGSVSFTKTSKMKVISEFENENGDINSEGDFFFKFFNIWKSEEVIAFDVVSNILSTDIMDNKKNDNYSRAKFLVFRSKEQMDDYIQKIGEGNIDRTVYRLVVVTEEDPSVVLIYKKWLSSMLFGTTVAISFFDRNRQGDDSFLLKYNFDGESFNSVGNQKNPYIRELKITFSHSGDSPQSVGCIKYRSHGALMKKFFINGSHKYGLVDTSTVTSEFFETMFTGIGIWDNRIFNLISNKDAGKLSVFKNLLSFVVGDQNEEISENHFREELKTNNHSVFVFHLSYIESLGAKHNTNKTQGLINWFWRTYICPDNIARDIPNSENFYKFPLLCITSGRGSDDWSRGIDPNIRPFVIFRPIESLANAVADALDIDDDFQLKYNLVKLLYGA